MPANKVLTLKGYTIKKPDGTFMYFLTIPRSGAVIKSSVPHYQRRENAKVEAGKVVARLGHLIKWID